MAAGVDGVSSASATKVNRLALASIFLAALAVVGTWFAGIAIPAAFAIVAGHVALVQVKRRHERGAALAVVALILSYAVVALVIFAALRGV
jgi:hypothetical protein